MIGTVTHTSKAEKERQRRRNENIRRTIIVGAFINAIIAIVLAVSVLTSQAYTVKGSNFQHPQAPEPIRCPQPSGSLIAN